MNAQSSKPMQGGSMDNVHNLTPEQDIEQQAADWLLRLDAEHKPSKSEIDELTAWVQRSPAHKEQLQRLAQYWHCANLPAELSLAPSGSAPSEPGNGNLLSRLFSSGWRATATLGVALSIAGALTMNLLTSDTSGISGNGIYETRTGEQNSITLRDGSVIQLNTGSRIHVNFVDKQRTVSLIAGEVHFQVAKDKTRPFIVKAGEGLVRAVGTAFSVRLHPEAVKVVVDEGKVALATSLDTPNSKSGSSRDTAETVKRAVDRGYLVQGQTVEFVPEAGDGLGNEIQELKQDDLDQQLAWRTGMLLFSGEPLAEAIAEINRYTSLEIKIIDQQIADLKIGGHFKVGETEAMLQALEISFGIRVTRPNPDTVHLALK